jgi:hypothetical protein
MTGGLVQRLPVTRVRAGAAGSVELGLATLLPHSPIKEMALRCSLWIALLGAGFAFRRRTVVPFWHISKNFGIAM